MNTQSNVIHIPQDTLTLRGDFTQSFLNKYDSTQTQRAYKQTILEFFKVSSTSQITLSLIKNLSATQSLDYITEISSRGNVKSTINRKVSALKSLIDYVNFLGLSIPNYFENKFLKKSVKTQSTTQNNDIDIFSVEEISQILASAKQYARVPQHYIILKLLFNSMARREEVVNIYPKDITSDSLTLRITKGRKERTVYLSPEMKSLLDSITFAPNCPIFNYTSDNVYKIINKYCKLAGIHKKQISPHIARHSAASIAQDNGATLTQIKNTLGHANESTTQRYLHNGRTNENSATRFVQF